MGIRNQAKTSYISLLPGLRLDTNPLAQQPGTARILRNWLPDGKRLMRLPQDALFTNLPTGITSAVWHIVNFRYTRAGAPENKVIIFRANGRVYQKTGGDEIEIFPGNTTFSALTKKPFQGQLSNRLFFSDGISSYVYDGRSVRVWGLTRSTTAPAVSAVGAGSLTAATGLKAAITWVVLDEASNRVHESSRSNVSSFQVLATENLRVDITALSVPSGTTHYSVYVSELDGSDVLKRSATTRVTTLTTDVSSLPSATAAKAPIRNDPPPPSTVGTVAKNRIILRDEANPDTYYFSALGEVNGLLNGAGEESFCGYGTNTVSDITNSDFIPERELRAIREHENVIYLFGEGRGYALVGELNLLDNKSPRSLIKLNQFPQGCAGPDAIDSTPYGLVWMTPARKLWLFAGGGELRDFGEAIQSIINSIPAASVDDVYLRWYEGNNRQWLVMCANTLAGEVSIDPISYVSNSASNRIYVHDFRFGEQGTLGTWVEWALTHGPTCVAQYKDDNGVYFLLAGHTNANVTQLDTIFSPTHLNRSFVLGRSSLGATPLDNYASTLKTSLVVPNNDQWCVVNYLTMLTGDHVVPGTPSVGAFTEPTISLWNDVENPDASGTAITLTLDTALTSGERRVWFIPQSSGNTNVGGAFLKHFIMQLAYSAGVDSTGDADGRLTARVNTIYKVGITVQPQKEMSR